jgi:hypothetical protein
MSADDEWFHEHGFQVQTEQDEAGEFWAHLKGNDSDDVLAPMYGRGPSRDAAIRVLAIDTNSNNSVILRTGSTRMSQITGTGLIKSSEIGRSSHASCSIRVACSLKLMGGLNGDGAAVR